MESVAWTQGLIGEGLKSRNWQKVAKGGKRWQEVAGQAAWQKRYRYSTARCTPRSHFEFFLFGFFVPPDLENTLYSYITVWVHTHAPRSWFSFDQSYQSVIRFENSCSGKLFYTATCSVGDKLVTKITVSTAPLLSTYKECSGIYKCSVLMELMWHCGRLHYCV